MTKMLELHTVFPNLNTDDSTGYCSSGHNTSKTYWDWEREVAIPAMKAEGYTDITFHTGESDSFGPLSRIAIAYKDGQRIKFFYG